MRDPQYTLIGQGVLPVLGESKSRDQRRVHLSGMETHSHLRPRADLA